MTHVVFLKVTYISIIQFSPFLTFEPTIIHLFNRTQEVADIDRNQVWVIPLPNRREIPTNCVIGSSQQIVLLRSIQITKYGRMIRSERLSRILTSPIREFAGFTLISDTQ